MVNYSIMDLAVGMVASRSYFFSQERVLVFANLVDDMAPVHFDNNFAKSKGFESKVVHGLFVQSIISGILGTEIPGPNSVINSLNIKMHQPTLIEQTVNYKIEITSITIAVSAVSLYITGQIEQNTVISGKAICSFPRIRIN